jgi:RNA-directed DNA polymerase
LVQQFTVPKNESELRIIQDRLYSNTLETIERGEKPRYKNLKEIIFNETNIVTAIHKIKSNKGSETAGTDKKIMSIDVLNKNYGEVIQTIMDKVENYKPELIRRVYIEKVGKKEKRPLGIPSIYDRIIQQCILQILEPICEAQFFEHSYGFRPMRESCMAIGRVDYILFQTDCRWVIEGDIKGFFDNVNHRILIKELWNIGIHDKRILMIIKAMLGAGIVNVCENNKLGTPQGGILSPLLANIYLNKFDNFITKQWEEKKTKINYARNDNRIYALRFRSNLKPMYLVRYADDWVILTNTRENAEKIKYKIKEYLRDDLNLELSEEKTKITNAVQKHINFLGYSIGLRQSIKGVKGYVNYSKPDEKKLNIKIKKLAKEIKNINKQSNKDEVVRQITLINSIIRGIVNYYENATMVNKIMHKYSMYLRCMAFRRLKRKSFNPMWVEANKVDNLKTIHEEYKTKIPTVSYKDLLIGVTDIYFIRWNKSTLKIQHETPYTQAGRGTYFKRTTRKRNLSRTNLSLNNDYLKWITLKKTKFYNFEYFMNREYAFNRDKGKCRTCGKFLNDNKVHIHHIIRKLQPNMINKVRNLMSVCIRCHNLIHNNESKPTDINDATWKKITKYRNKLN